MRSNKRTGTRPELALRSALHARGHRFRKDLRFNLGSARPRPDIVFTRKRVAVFVDGCFWHSCADHQGAVPRANAGFWAAKFAGTIERDEANNAALREAGWVVVRVWEHEPLPAAVAKVEAALARSVTNQG